MFNKAHTFSLVLSSEFSKGKGDILISYSYKKIIFFIFVWYLTPFLLSLVEDFHSMKENEHDNKNQLFEADKKSFFLKLSKRISI